MTKKLKKMGNHASDTGGACLLITCASQSTNRIGDEGMGFIYQMQQFQNERLVACDWLRFESESDACKLTIEYTHEVARPLAGL